MIVLNTNVVSEALKSVPHSAVQAWLDEQVAETLYLSSVTLAELLFGIGSLPVGKRRNALSETLDGLLELFGERILAFDTRAARHYADLAVKARQAGKGFPTPDGYIASIAVAHGFVVATRDISPFEAAGVATIDPWAWKA
ncbi:type II toxin-antitoxin system VapC family toxin [Burkholderia guangdongensis]|uniref:type II toxin-antitoxin system VapC family toxin n=1 Tax=Burkholderia guangdongensis TaxID=1792500 RepID=UPI0015C6FB80|nr:type II toxin-antitoxin system VapC family toxin [Burkholderia guangdongensis]